MIEDCEFAKKIVWFKDREHFFLPLPSGLRDLHLACSYQKQRISGRSLPNDEIIGFKIHLSNRDGPQCIRAHIGKKAVTEKCVIHRSSRNNRSTKLAGT